MKTTVKLMAMATAVAALASCMGSDSVYNPDATAESAKAQYKKTFESKYGKVSPDNDWGLARAKAKMASTRGIDSNANMWEGYTTVPPKVEQDEIDVVVKYFREHTGEDLQSVFANWSDFFLQQIYVNPDKLPSDDANNPASPEAQICNFKFGENGNTIANNGKIDERQVNSSRGNERIALVQGEKPTELMFQNTLDSKWYTNSIIFKIGDSYYIGFDYESNGDTDEKKVKRDYCYVDCIFKITPADYKGNDVTRVMCEDLGITTGDLDFNDVVFDVYQQWNGLVITIRAAGGTLPLYVDGVEVHEALGIATNVMANTGKDTKTVPVAIFRIEKKELESIIVEVRKEGATPYRLEANKGEATQKVYVDTDCEPQVEYEDINGKYQYFSNYVQDPENYPIWWKM